MESIADGDGNTTLLDVSLADRREIVTDPTGDLTTILYHDETGDIVRTDRIFDGRTITTRAVFDDLDRLRTETDALGGVTHYDWSDKGDLIHVQDQAGHDTTMTYDEHGLLTSIKADDDTTVLGLFYDANGNLERQQAADGTATHFTWLGGHLMSVADDFGHTTAYEYTPEGYVEDHDPRWPGEDVHLRRLGPDPVGDRAGTRRHALHLRRRGNLLTTTDAQSRVRRYTYDAFDHLLTDTDYANRTTSYTYGPTGRLDHRTDRSGQAVAYTYDDAGRIATKTLPGGVVTTYAYDCLADPSTCATPTVGSSTAMTTRAGSSRSERPAWPARRSPSSISGSSTTRPASSGPRDPSVGRPMATTTGFEWMRSPTRTATPSGSNTTKSTA